jgi:hypothetical protein
MGSRLCRGSGLCICARGSGRSSGRRRRASPLKGAHAARHRRQRNIVQVREGLRDAPIRRRSAKSSRRSRFADSATVSCDCVIISRVSASNRFNSARPSLPNGSVEKEGTGTGARSGGPAHSETHGSSVWFQARASLCLQRSYSRSSNAPHRICLGHRPHRLTSQRVWRSVTEQTLTR